MEARNLELMIDKFLSEEAQDYHVSEIVVYYPYLKGSDLPFAPMGYLKFLKAMGIDAPTTHDLNSHYIGRFWEFTAQHFGLLAAEEAMVSRQDLWRWAQLNGQLPVAMAMPAVLRGNTVAKPYKLEMKITEPRD